VLFCFKFPKISLWEDILKKYDTKRSKKRLENMMKSSVFEKSKSILRTI